MISVEIKLVAWKIKQNKYFKTQKKKRDNNHKRKVGGKKEQMEK